MMSPKMPEQSPTWRDYAASGPLPVVRGVRQVQGILIDQPWANWEEQTSESDRKPRAVYYSLAFALCHGPVKEIVSLTVNGRKLGWIGGEGADYNLPVPFKVRPTDPEDPEYYSAPFTINLHNKSTPVQGRIYWGDPDQPADPLLSRQVPYLDIQRGGYWHNAYPQGGYNTPYTVDVAGVSKLRVSGPPHEHPSYAGICYVVFYAYETDFSLREGGAAIGDMQFEVACGNERYTDPIDFSQERRTGVNPVGTVIDILKDEIWGLGLPESIAPLATLQDAAERMGTEGYHVHTGGNVWVGFLSPFLAENRTAAEMLRGIFDYFDGFLRWDNGVITVDWLPNKTIDIEGMQEIDRSMMLEELKTLPGAVDTWDKTVNEITVEFTDRTQNFGNATRTVRNPANREIVGEPRLEKLDAKQIIWPDTATAYAARKLAQKAEPIRAYEVKLPADRAVKPSGEPLRPGDLFLLDYAPWNLDVVVRIRETEEADSKVTLIVDTEPGNYPLEYVPAADPRQLPEPPVAVPFVTVRPWQLPPQLAGQAWPPVAVLLAVREHPTIFAAEVYFSRTGDFEGEEQTLAQLGFFAGKATLLNDIDASAGEVTLYQINFDAYMLLNESLTNAESDDDTLLALIDDELVSLSALETPGDETRTYNVLRGRQGTLAAAHNGEPTVWLFRRSALQRYRHESFSLKPPYSATNATSYWRLAPRTTLELGQVSASFELELANPFPTVAWVHAPVDTLYNKAVNWEALVTNTTGKPMRVYIGLAGPSGQWLPLYYDETTDPTVSWVYTAPMLPKDGPTGTWRLGVWAAYVAALDATTVAIGEDFTLAAPVLTPSLTAPGNIVNGKVQSYAGSIANPEGYQVDWTLFVDKGSVRKFVYTGTSFDTTIDVAASRLWTDEEAGTWTLTLIAQHRYQGAALQTATQDFTLAAPVLTPSLTAPGNTLHSATEPYEGSISNPSGLKVRWFLTLFSGLANIVIADGESTDTTIDVSAEHTWTVAQAAGTWTLALSCYHTYEGASGTPVTADDDFTVAEPTLNLSLTPPGNATQGFVQSFAGTISNPDGLQVDWTLFVDKGSTRKFVYNGTSFDTTISVAASRLWTETDLGAWTLTLFAQHRYQDAPLKTDQEGFTLIAPTLTPSVNTPSNTAQGKSEVYSGSISNPAGLLTRFVLMLEKGSQTIILLSNVSNSTAINMSAPKLWTAEEAGTWTLRLDCYHIYEGAPAHPVTADETFSVSATSITANFSLPAADAVLLHRQKYDVEFTITNPLGIECLYNLIYEGPSVGGKRRNIMFSSGTTNATETITARLDTSILDLYSLAEQAASPYRLRLIVVNRLGKPQVNVYRNFTVSLPQPLSAHFGAKTVQKLTTEGHHLRDGDLRAEAGAEWRYEEATTSWKRQTATKIVSATRPDGTEVGRTDFTAGNSLASAFNGTLTSSQTVLGSAGWLRYYANAANDYHGIYLSWGTLIAERKYRIRLKLYIPTGQSSSSILIALHGQAVEQIITASGEAQIWETTFTSALSTPILYLMLRATFSPFVGANSPTDDYFYVKDFAIIDITDGIEVIHNDRWLNTSDDYKAYLFDSDLLQWNRDNTTLSASRIATGIIESAIIQLYGAAILRGTGDTDIDTGGGLFLRGENGSTKAQLRAGDVTGDHIMFDGQTGEFSLKIGDFELTNDTFRYGNTDGWRVTKSGDLTTMAIGGLGDDTIYIQHDAATGRTKLVALDIMGNPVIELGANEAVFKGVPLNIGEDGTPVRLMKLYEVEVVFSAQSNKTVTIDISSDGFPDAPDYVIATIARISGTGTLHRHLGVTYLKESSSNDDLLLEVYCIDSSNRSGTVHLHVQAFYTN